LFVQSVEVMLLKSVNDEYVLFLLFGCFLRGLARPTIMCRYRTITSLRCQETL